MPRRTRTFVPKNLLLSSSPEVRVATGRTLVLRIVGVRGRMIARIEVGRRGISLFGAREGTPWSISYEQLQLKGTPPAEAT